MTTLICQNEQRREAVRRDRHLNGLDYLEVGPDQRTLTVYFLGKAQVPLEPSNVRIEGGRRIRDLQVIDLRIYRYDDPELDDCMTVIVDRAGDFSTYTLRLVEQDKQGEWRPHSAFDPRYDRLDFSFKVDCPSDLDCYQPIVCPPEERQEPEINYLAKDYASFRQLILDRLALIMPEWQERHVPDIGIALVEVLAYVGDHLSYYQDAVATEAYLDTARQRISMRRHVRLVDYPMHEGCNARAWVCVETENDLTLDPRDVYFITGYNNALDVKGHVLTAEDVRLVSASRYEVFEPMADAPIKLYARQHELHFYTWGNRECCLPRGATSATLIGELVPEAQPEEPPPCDPEESEPAPPRASTTDAPPKLHLKVGDVLILEEVIGPKTGDLADADPSHRHAVRLTRVEASVDPLTKQPVVEIAWAEEDALPFPLCISVLGPPPECQVIENVSVARGNTILVDHGWTTEEDLGTVPVKEIIERCECEGRPADTSLVAGHYRPQLHQAPLAFSQPLPAHTPASRTLVQDPRQALPQVWLTGTPSASDDPRWVAQRDLLGSHSRDQHFVAEIDNEGRAHLRFGDGELGRAPEAGTAFRATYRVGNGLAGHVGAEAISHIVFRRTRLSDGIRRVRNPLPARGGTPPEPLVEVKLFAPRAFRKELQRAITPEDYAYLVMRDFKDKVQRAAAVLRWTGSWYEVLVAVDQLGREEADAALLDEITKRLHRYRRIGQDVVVKSARRVPLDIELLVCVQPDYLRGHVKAALLELFSNRLLPDGRRGFFHPDNLTFGEGIYLSKLVAAAQAVPGVESVRVEKLERLNEGPQGEVASGLLPLGPLEIARLDNDPSFPENGRLVLTMRGGR